MNRDDSQAVSNAVDDKKVGFWLPAVMFSMSHLNPVLPPFIEDWLGFVPFDRSVDGLWIEMRADLGRGLVLATMLVMCVLAAAIVWRRYSAWALLLAMNPLACWGYQIFQAGVVYRECPELLDGWIQASPWSTLNEYRQDPLWDKAWGFCIFCSLHLTVAIIVAHKLLELKRSRLPEPAPSH